jgi:hypothetical protein
MPPRYPEMYPEIPPDVAGHNKTALINQSLTIAFLQTISVRGILGAYKNKCPRWSPQNWMDESGQAKTLPDNIYPIIVDFTSFFGFSGTVPDKKLAVRRKLWLNWSLFFYFITYCKIMIIYNLLFVANEFMLGTPFSLNGCSK